MQKSPTPARKKRVAASKSDAGAATSRVEARKSAMDAVSSVTAGRLGRAARVELAGGAQPAMNAPGSKLDVLGTSQHAFRSLLDAPTSMTAAVRGLEIRRNGPPSRLGAPAKLRYGLWVAKMSRAYSIVALSALFGLPPLLAAMAHAETPTVHAVFVVKEHDPLLSPAAECPDGMALVDGAWCPRIEQRCLRWMDPPGKYHKYRCAEYARPVSCLAPRVHKRFCVDRRERTELATGLPLNVQSWTDAKRACEDAGARVCMDSEWTFACEGEEMRPYPYGWSRASRECNADRTDLLTLGEPRRLRDEREPAHASCASPFGVLDMAGNVAEWVSVDGHPEGSVVVQKGNWWQPGKHACRDEQAGHNRFYKGTETGFRCCATAR